MSQRMLIGTVVFLVLLAVGVVAIAVSRNPNPARWKKAATELGLVYDGADNAGKLSMSGQIDGLPIRLFLDGRGAGDFYWVWTQARVTAGLSELVYLDSEVERNPVLRLEAKLAEQVEIGDPDFDEVYRVQGDPQALKRLLDEPSRRALLDTAKLARVRVVEGDVIVERLDLVTDPDELVKLGRAAIELTQTLRLTRID